MSVFEVVHGVSQQPPGPVDEVDGAGELVVGGGDVVDVPNADHADTGHVGVVDEGESWLYEDVLLGDQSLDRPPGLRVYRADAPTHHQDQRHHLQPHHWYQNHYHHSFSEVVQRSKKWQVVSCVKVIRQIDISV